MGLKENNRPEDTCLHADLFPMRKNIFFSQLGYFSSQL